MDALTQEEREELDRRFKAACERVTPEAIANGHAYQLAVMTCKARNMLLMCSRRAGKTRGLCGLMLLTAIATPGCSSLYLALTAGQAEKVWRRHWLPMLRKFKVPFHKLEGDSMITTFPNGATVIFSGTNNLRTVTHLLGDSMAGGIAVFDEQQSDPGVLEDAAVNIVGPMIEETTAEIPVPGRQVIAGTVPDDPIGYFWKLWTDNYDDETGKHKPDAEWQCFAWSRFENPHEKDNQWHMEVYCKKFKLAIDDPIVLRNWKGVRVWDVANRCYGYTVERNRWTGKVIRAIERSETVLFDEVAVKPPHGIDRFWVGVKPASMGKFAIVLFGTSSKQDSGIWQLAEATSAPEADPHESQWVSVIDEWRDLYAPFGRFVRFIGAGEGNKETEELFLRTHGFYLETAIKGTGALRATIDHVRDLNMTGKLHALEGSELEIDFIKTAWSKKDKKRDKWVIDPKWKPSAGAAATFILPAWTPQRQAEDDDEGLTEEQVAAKEARKSFLKRYEGAPKTPGRRRRPELWSKRFLPG